MNIINGLITLGYAYEHHKLRYIHEVFVTGALQRAADAAM